eukprot:77525-Ditylum_brightwellii.AAC.1
MEAQMLLEMTIEVHAKKQFIVGCVVADDDSTMREALCHSYEELLQQFPVYVWPHAPSKKEGKLGTKLRNTGKLPLHLVDPSWKADPTHCIKIIT